MPSRLGFEGGITVLWYLFWAAPFAHLITSIFNANLA